ncbi:molybdenum cofactor guanylyltransferase [Arsenicitalea aurantiaca]|uniref:Molybdenum cofactor guanylyltransferase n=1 Tax=Arsenicitalea aurantiaca TaxID=1783274 RepID=A0A433XES2_9HYPH|nr:molybdenum cofactor guanylyltransferase [Arsenicitalea aurantiaca]RUT32617.1 molybdenum cofactor guanylyltransferase [Arsenicitalea aurantiaca]
MKIVAVILAGGLGSRLGGVQKATLRIGGQRLLERTHASLAIEVDEVLVASGQFDLRSSFPRLEAIFVKDRPGLGEGPIAGLAATVEILAARPVPPDLMVSVAVDTPFLPADFTARLRDRLEDEHDAMTAAYAGQPYPTNTLWRFRAIADLPGRLAGDQPLNSPRALLRQIRANHLDWSETASLNPFANLNTLGDLVSLGTRARNDRRH